MSNHFVKLFVLSFFTFVTLIASSATNAIAAPRVVSVNLRAERLAIRSRCPETVDFYGSITMDGRGAVRYTFERSDGATGPVHTLFFPTAGTKTVSNTWTLSANYSGYQKLKVLSPNPMESAEARFNLNCAGGGGIPIDPPRPPMTRLDVFCPLESARTEVVSSLPEGWWQTPQVGRLVSLGVENIGGEPALVCRYSAYGTQVSVMRKFPRGRTNCMVRGNRFVCE